MSDFQLYFEMGLYHVLDINAYDHILFLIALTVPYNFKDWKNVLLLASLFTIGHTVSLILSVMEVVTVNPVIIEFLIPITILITALYNIIKWGKRSLSKQNSINFAAVTTLLFGIIHGLGFSNYFKLVIGEAEDKLVPLLEFALGIEASQVIIVMAVLIGAQVLQFFRLNKRDWILLTSAFVVGVVVPMIIGSEIW